jgi:hypothetical protein
MRSIFFATALLALAAATPAQAVTRYQIGTGTTLGGFCRWYAFIDTYPDGSYRLYYETDCGANGLAVPRDRSGRTYTLSQMRALTLTSPEAIAAGRQAPRAAQRFEQGARVVTPSRTGW